MAYVSQKDKKLLAPGIKKVLKKYGLRGTIGVDHHSTLVVNIWEGNIDFIGGWGKNQNINREEHQVDGYIQVNEYWIENNYSGAAKNCLMELKEAMNGCEEIQNFDKSDIMTDYFHVGWYISINIGTWEKDYILNVL